MPNLMASPVDSVGPKLLSFPARLVHVFIPSPSNTAAMANILKNVLGVKQGEAAAKADLGTQSTSQQCDGNCIQSDSDTSPQNRVFSSSGRLPRIRPPIASVSPQNLT